MSAIYDSWERLVAAVLKKEQIRQLCHADSIATSVGSLAYTSILSPSLQNDDVYVSSHILGSISPYSQSCSSVETYDEITTVVKRLRGSDNRHETVAPRHDSYFSYEDEMLVIYEYQSLDGAPTLPHGKKHGIHRLNWEPRVRMAIAVAKAINANNHESLLMLSGIDDLEKMEAATSIVILPTAGYRAPVVMKYAGHPSKASDVYSFGVLLLELLMCDKVVITREGLVRWAIRKFHEVGTLIVFEFVWVRDSNKLIDMWRMFLVAMRCVEGKPGMRPEMCDVLKMMEGIRTCSS